MQVKVTRPIYIRKGPGRSHGLLAPIFPSGKGIEMDGVEKGETWKGIDQWYFKINEKGEKQYYWAGGLSREIVFPPQPFNWNILFHNIGSLVATRGAGITVAVLDDGLDIEHGDFTGAFNNVIDTTGNTTAGLNRHGTSVAGIIGARGTSGKGITGVAPACRIIPVRIFRPNDFKPSYAIDGIDKAIAAGADIINISMTLEPSPDLDRKITETVNAGIPVIVSAGDQGELLDPLSFPANNTACITVGSCTSSVLNNIKNDIPDTVHFVGGHVSRWVCSNGENTFYAQDMGSSFCCAYVSGLIALLFSQLKRQGTDIRKVDRAAIIGKLTPLITPFNDSRFMDSNGFGFDIISRIKKTP